MIQKKANRPFDRLMNALPLACWSGNEEEAKENLTKQGLVHQKAVPCEGQEERSSIGRQSKWRGNREVAPSYSGKSRISHGCKLWRQHWPLPTMCRGDAGP